MLRLKRKKIYGALRLARSLRSRVSAGIPGRHDLIAQRRECPDYDPKIERKGPLLRVRDVQLDHLRKTHPVLAGNLPEPRDPRRATQPLPVPRRVVLVLIRDAGART